LYIKISIALIFNAVHCKAAIMVAMDMDSNIDSSSFCLTHNLLVSNWCPGDRSGHIILWDTGTCDKTWQMKNVHQGHVTALTWFDYEDGSCAGCFASGGQVSYTQRCAASFLLFLLARLPMLLYMHILTYYKLATFGSLML
jgi:hypothetical protein